MIDDRQSDDRTVASFDLIAWARATLFAPQPEIPPNVELPAAKVQPDRLPSVRRIVDLSALSPQSERSLRASRQRESSSMSKIAFHRGLAKLCRSFGDWIKR